MMHLNTTSALSSSASSDKSGVLTFVLWASVFFAMALLINLITLPLGRDQAVFSLIGGGMLEGRAPYSETWDIKSPGIYFVYALAHAVFGEAAMAPRLLEIVAMLAMGLGFYKLSDFIGDARAAALAFALTLFGMVKFGFWHTAQPETFAAVLLIWAVVATQHRWYVTVGALYFCAALLKPSFGGGIIPSMIYAIVMIPKDRRSWFNVFSVLLRFGVGGAIITALCLGYMWLSGGLAEFVWTMFSFMPSYLGDVSTENPRSLAFLFAKSSWRLATIWPAIMIGLGLAAFFSLRNTALRSTALLILGVAFFPLVGVALQGKFFPYHFLATVGPLGLVAGWGYWLALTSTRTNGFMRLGLIGVLGAAMIMPTSSMRFFQLSADRAQAAVLTQPADAEDNPAFFSWPSFDRVSMMKASAWIKANTAEDDSIYVWGFDPNFYLLADRPYASRFISNFTQRVTWSADATRQELMETLQTVPPRVIIVSKNDIMRAVTGNLLSSEDVLENDFTELKDFMAARYTFVDNYGNFDIYKLADGAS